jgi:hypothetical protein
MQEMADGKAVPPFTPRKRDLMQELFATFNTLIRTWNARLGTDAGAGETNGSGHPAVQQKADGSQPLQV